MKNEFERQLLKEWKLEADLPPGFNSAVWRRIEQQSAPRPASIGQAAAEWLNNLFSRPAVVVGYASVAIVLGLAAGQWRASTELRDLESRLEARYVQSIDPYVPRAP